MNNLGLYIKEALKERQEISVPGIGVFTKERMPAYFDASQEKFMPPVTHITLHEIEDTDDSLVNFIAQNKDINAEEARSKLEKELDVLRFDLQRHSDVLLEGLGRLSKKDDKLAFSATSSDDELKAYEPVAEAEILRPISVEKEIVAAPIEDHAPQEIDQEQEMVQELGSEPSSSRRRLWPAIAVAICVVLAGFWFLRPSLPQPVDGPIEEQKVEVAPVIAAPDTSKVALSVSDSVSESVNKPEESYEIIIAAFNTMKEAQEYVARTNAKGHQVYILKNNRPSNLNKISYSSFKTEKEATLALAKVRKELTSEAWIYKRIKYNKQ